MKGLSPRLAGLFVLALLGALVVVGLALAQLGLPVLLGYLLLVTAALAYLARSARRMRAARDHGRTCTCCTTTVFDPVEIR